MSIREGKRRHLLNVPPKKFSFMPVNYIPLEDREYGLLRTKGDNASTPHPRKWHTNLSTLCDRLNEVEPRQKLEAEEFNTNVFVNENVFLQNEDLKSEEVDRVKELPQKQASISYRGILRTSAIKKGNQKDKKVILLSPQDNFFFKLRSPPEIVSLQRFHERRKLFHEAEFTIAKKGKKMSDVLITTCEQKTSDDFSELDEATKLQPETMSAKHSLRHGRSNARSISEMVK